MANQNRRAGTITLKVGGVQLDAKGNFTYNLGTPSVKPLSAPTASTATKRACRTAFIEGEITDRKNLKLADLSAIDSETVTLELGVGKTIVLSQAWYAGEGTGNSEEGNIGVRFESRFPAQEI